MAKKDIEARSRVEIKRQLNELNMKLESENKSREAIDKYRYAPPPTGAGRPLTNTGTLRQCPVPQTNPLLLGQRQKHVSDQT